MLLSRGGAAASRTWPRRPCPATAPASCPSAPRARSTPGFGGTGGVGPRRGAGGASRSRRSRLPPQVGAEFSRYALHRRGGRRVDVFRGSALFEQLDRLSHSRHGPLKGGGGHDLDLLA